jgi:hypothetical protein
MSRVNISVQDDELWLAFRLACLARKTSASKVIVQLVREQLARWKQEERVRQAPGR